MKREKVQTAGTAKSAPQNLDGENQRDDILRFPGLYAGILDIADDAVISVDSAQRILIFNQGAERIFGYEAENVLGQPLDILLPERFRNIHWRHIQGFLEGATAARRMGERSEIFALRSNGEEFPAEASISKTRVGAEVIPTVILRDISDRKAGEERLVKALEEKDVLLREIHHRVKNNLQVISSLLSLQAGSVSETETRQALEDSQERVQTMALIHNQLYESRDFTDIDFREYVRQLTAHLLHAFQGRVANIRLETEMRDVKLGVDLAVPCALIVHELVSNSLKHGFPEGQTGFIRIAVEKKADQSIVLAVTDSGVGLPPEVGFWNTKTIGLRLVRALVRQLDGEVEVGGPPGTEFRVRFSPL